MAARRFDALGAHLRAAHLAAGMTQRILGYRAGSQQALVSRVERGEARFGRDLTLRIADVLSLDPAELLRLAGHHETDAGR